MTSFNIQYKLKTVFINSPLKNTVSKNLNLKKKFMKMGFSLIFWGVTSLAEARWTEIKIPGAQCGTGQPYKVYIDLNKNSDQYYFEFMGGGACWSQETCWGLNARTILLLAPPLPYLSMPSAEFFNNPLKNHNKIYFPYCTGDVFLGNHTKVYQSQFDMNGTIFEPKKVFHVGHSNIQKSLKHLMKRNYIKPQMSEIILYGASAGALGALNHIATFDQLINADKKIIFADSAGLHFGADFWKKFTPELMADFTESFSKINLMIDPNDGFVAPRMRSVFNSHLDWNFIFFQSAYDATMSEAFGKISLQDHAKLVYSDQGLQAIAKDFNHVKVWTTNVSQHTFMISPLSSRVLGSNNISSWDFFVKNYYLLALD